MKVVYVPCLCLQYMLLVPLTGMLLKSLYLWIMLSVTICNIHMALYGALSSLFGMGSFCLIKRSFPMFLLSFFFLLLNYNFTVALVNDKHSGCDSCLQFFMLAVYLLHCIYIYIYFFFPPLDVVPSLRGPLWGFLKSVNFGFEHSFLSLPFVSSDA